MQNNDLKIAVAHSKVSGDVRQNTKNIKAQIKAAAEAGCRLIQFTEGAISGLFWEHIKNWQEVDQGLLLSQLEDICKFAQELKIWVALGCNHHLSKDNLPHCSTYIISDEGQVVTRYDKRYLSETNITKRKYAPGKSAVTFEIDGILMGCVSGTDIFYNAPFDEYRDLGVECVLFSVNLAHSQSFLTMAQAHANQSHIWMTVSTNTDNIFPLASHFIGPDGAIANSSDYGTPGLAIGKISLNDPGWDIPINQSRPWRKLAREGLAYQDYYVEDTRSEIRNRF